MQRNKILAPIQLDAATAMKICSNGSMFQEKLLLKRTDLWHKFTIVKGAKYDKEIVLNAILNAVQSAEIIPVKYQISGEDSFFISRNCGPAIEKLCQNNLVVKCFNGHPIILIITLAYALIHDLKVNVQQALFRALTNRYDSENKVLNLKCFHKDPDLEKVAYFPVAQSNILCHILKLASTSVRKVEHINLQDNCLISLAAFESSDLLSINSLDLRYNNLLNMRTLSSLSKFPISVLWLDGNPLCENYYTSGQYIESARNYCPSLTKLDDVNVDMSGLPLTRINYFTNSNQHKLVKQFITHFFNLYDQNNRDTLLRGLYKRNAFYSLTYGITFEIASKKGLIHITASRNILDFTDNNSVFQFLFCGSEKILCELGNMPKTYHFRDSFQCDMVYSDGQHFIISVSGILKVLSAESHYLSFNRTFVLLAAEDNEFIITNDMYHLDFAPANPLRDTIIKTIPYSELELTCFNLGERTEMIYKLQHITRMCAEWCEKYLKKTNFDIRTAINKFLEDFSSDSLPPEAFQKSKYT
ncbi:nuclear RNA export factor 1-like [Prorops nasuta]|uniref:nuclear RNA export factor 1-like n=1 Tax=Prorops nasuta TaxID=863751 RepID=UPI0034CFBC1E